MYKVSLTLCLIAALAGCGAPDSEPPAAPTAERPTAIGAASSDRSPQRGSGVHPDTIDNTCNLAKNLLTYGGGPLLTSVTIVPVNWNSSVASKMSKMSSFYQELIGSTLWQWVTSEYSTATQNLAGWTSYNTYTLARTETFITDANVRNALETAIGNGTLPQTSGLGYANGKTLYVVHLPPNTVGNDSQGNQSCPNPSKGKNSWYGYHDYDSWNGQQIYYVVLADTSVDCTSSAYTDYFDTATRNATHEIFEAVTDPQVGSGWFYTAWQTSPITCSGPGEDEIGDLCNQKAGTIRGSSAQNGGPASYAVQLEYSNRTGQCYDTFCQPQTCAQLGYTCGSYPDGCGGTLTCGSCPSGQACGIGGQPNVCAPLCVGPACFGLSLGSSADSLPAGDTMSVPLNVTVGTCSPVQLSVSGALPGVSASTSVTSVSASGSSWLYLGVDSSTPPESMTLTVTGTCRGGSQSVPFQLSTLACQPHTCSGQCGTVADGCGNTISCGGCATGYTCTQNQCVSKTVGTCTTARQCCIENGGTWSGNHCI